MRIVYNIAGFYRPAGMERVLADKANWLVQHGHQAQYSKPPGKAMYFTYDMTRIQEPSMRTVQGRRTSIRMVGQTPVQRTGPGSFSATRCANEPSHVLSYRVGLSSRSERERVWQLHSVQPCQLKRLLFSWELILSSVGRCGRCTPSVKGKEKSVICIWQ